MPSNSTDFPIYKSFKNFWKTCFKYIVPVEQSSFHSIYLLATRVLSDFQKIKNSMVANIISLAIYVD
jgi:hypothetical protein